MLPNIFKLKIILSLFLSLVLCLAPIQSMAIVGTQASLKRAQCTSIFNSGISNGTNYLLAAGCYGQLFNDPANTETNKELNNKTFSLQSYNNFCKSKFNQNDFAGARDCFQAAIYQSCDLLPKIDEHCDKFQNNAKVSAAAVLGQFGGNSTNFDMVNNRKIELNTCNQKYFSGNYADAQNCYQNGVGNTCNTFTNNSELDELCGKFRNNYSVAQNTINNTNVFGGNANISRVNQETANLARCNQIYYSNNYGQAADCYQKGINNTCNNNTDYNSDLNVLCDKNRNNYQYTSNILSYCYGGYNNYNTFNSYNNTNCRQNSNGTLEIIAGVATALVVACLFFCNTGTSANNTTGYKSY